MKSQVKTNAFRSFVGRQKRSIGAVLLILALSMAATAAMAATVMSSV